MVQIQRATLDDAAEILALQKLAYQSEAEIYNDFKIPPLQQNLEETIKEFSEQVVLKLCDGEKIIGSVRACAKEGTCYIGKVIVHPAYQGKGLGMQLIHSIESVFQDVKRFELFTGCRSERNLYFYQKLGYRIFDQRPASETHDLFYLEKDSTRLF